ncbi:hypothetical protein BJ742DRAFT_800948, partial [Cladochytrium replicatum]
MCSTRSSYSGLRIPSTPAASKELSLPHAVGKDQQFFGKWCNLAKLRLYVLNHARDEITGKHVAPLLWHLSLTA